MDDEERDEALEAARLPPERPERVPEGRYPLLLPLAQHLVIDHGVSVRVVARVFGLKQSTLTMRLSELEAFQDREVRDSELARQALVEAIRRGMVPAKEFWPHLTRPYRRELRNHGFSPPAGYEED